MDHLQLGLATMSMGGSVGPQRQDMHKAAYHGHHGQPQMQHQGQPQHYQPAPIQMHPIDMQGGPQ